MRDENEAQNFITDVLCGLWPRWEPKDTELAEWKRRLMPYDYYRGKTAVKDLFFEATQRTIEPPAGKIISVLRLKAFDKTTKTYKEQVALFEITREDGTRRWSPFFGDPDTPREIIERDAEFKRDQANQIWPEENHIIFYLNIEEEKEDTGYYGPDARQRAIDSILAGPDTKTKRWLQKHFAKKEEPKKTNEPVHIGDDIPF